MFPPPADFLSQLRDLHIGSSNHDGKPVLPKKLLDPLLELILAFYNREFVGPALNAAKLANPWETLTVFLTACYQAMNAFRDALPPSAFETLPPGFLMREVTLDLRSAHEAFGATIRLHREPLNVVGMANVHPPFYLEFDEPMPYFDEPEPRFTEDEPADSDEKRRWRNRRRDFDNFEVAWWKERKRDFEQLEIPAWKARKAAYEKAQKLNFHDRTPDELAFIGTPFYYLWLTLPPELTYQAPFEIPLESRFKHQWVISPSGGGKTTLLESQLIRDLDRVARGECSVVVIDSQAKPGEPSLIPNIASLKLFAPGQPLGGKLVLLEPDPEYPLALNLFDQSLAATKGMSPRDREIYETSAAEMISFSLSAMTDQQDDLFSYVVQFLMGVPGATIDDVAKILEPGGIEHYRKFLDKADPQVQKFFNTMFDGKGFQVTRDAVARRVAGVLKNKTFRHMFQSKTNKFNMLNELSEPKVILINTDMAYLGASACQIFGRFFISQIVRMVQVRGAGLPVFCYIDEVHDYLFPDDENLEFLNDKARKRNVGMIYAHQRLSNIKSDGVRDSLCNVDVQFAGGNRTDAKLLAQLINATPEQISAMPVGNFMAYVQRHTPAAVQVEVAELMPTMPRMTDAEMLHIKHQMRERYARPLHEVAEEARPEPVAAPAPEPPAAADAADAKPW